MLVAERRWSCDPLRCDPIAVFLSDEAELIEIPGDLSLAQGDWLAQRFFCTCQNSPESLQKIDKRRVEFIG
jgi:hypothetical protein